MKTYKNRILTKKDIEEKGFTIENDMVKYIDISIKAHFGNRSFLNVQLTNTTLFSEYVIKKEIGDMLKIIVELLGIEQEDGLMLSNIKNIPCRVVLSDNDLFVGIGHFIRDRYLLLEDILDIAFENATSLKG